jgi:hypothetical protein
MSQYLGKNSHLSVTTGNYKLTNTLQEKHYALISAEAGDADFDAMILFFKPVHLNWDTKYPAWKSAADVSQGKTREFLDLFDQYAHKKLLDWEVAIYNAHAEYTPEAKAILPNKRNPYLKGTQFARIQALLTLAENIGGDAALAATKADIIAFHDKILKVYEEHQAAMNKIKILSKDLEPLRVEVCEALYANEGSLMKKFKSTPAKVDLYFDVKSMRQSAKKPSDEGGMSVPLLPGQIELLNLQYKGTEVWQVENLAEKDVCLFFSDKDDLTQIPADWKYIVTAELPIEIDLNTIPKDKRFVYAANLSTEDEGELNITEIKK